MPESVWGADGASPEPPPKHKQVGAPPARQQPPARVKRPPEPTPDWLRSTPDDGRPEPTDRDPVAVTAVACGFVGIVLLGLLLAVVTGFLGAWAGQRARESGRTFELPYLALLLAFVDGAVWIVLHLLIDAPFWVG